jgi:hypothetical protein
MAEGCVKRPLESRAYRGVDPVNCAQSCISLCSTLLVTVQRRYLWVVSLFQKCPAQFAAGRLTSVSIYLPMKTEGPSMRSATFRALRVRTAILLL